MFFHIYTLVIKKYKSGLIIRKEGRMLCLKQRKLTNEVHSHWSKVKELLKV